MLEDKIKQNNPKPQVEELRHLVKTVMKRIRKAEAAVRQTQRSAQSRSHESSRIVGSQAQPIFESVPQQPQPVSGGGQNIMATKLIEDIQEAVAADTLGSKPIEGVDIPMKQVQYGRGGELLLVQDLDQAEDDEIQEDVGITKQAFEKHFRENMYQYLVPSGFKKFTHEYIEEQDIHNIKAPVKPKPPKPITGEKTVKEKRKEAREKKEQELFEVKPEVDANVTAEQRDKTIKLMVKLLSRHVEDAKEEASELKTYFKQTEDKIKGFHDQLEREEVQVILDDIKHRKDLAQKEIEESMSGANELKAQRDIRLEDLMVDNEVMMAEIK